MAIVSWTVMAMMISPIAGAEDLAVQEGEVGLQEAWYQRVDQGDGSEDVCIGDAESDLTSSETGALSSFASAARTDSSAASVDPTVADPTELRRWACCAGAGGCGVFPGGCPGGTDPVSCPCPPAA